MVRDMKDLPKSPQTKSSVEQIRERSDKDVERFFNKGQRFINQR